MNEPSKREAKNHQSSVMEPISISALRRLGREVGPNYTTAPVHEGQLLGGAPEFLRLPKPGTTCPFSGLSRSSLNELILPCAANNWKPPVRSFPLRKRGAQRGIRLIIWSSLKAHLYAQEAAGSKGPETNS